MNKLKAIIVDDEDLARKNLEFLLKDFCPQVEVVHMANGAKSATEYLKSNSVDIMFLDIEMPNGSGFDLLESLESIDFKIVFITAYHEYALKAFRYSAVDYILKPIDPEELERAVSKASKSGVPESKEKIELLIENMERKGEMLNKIALPSMEGLQFVNLDEIIYCESEDNYTQFFLTNGKKIMVSKTIKHFEELLDEGKFFRVHRSNIINLEYIDRYVKGEGGYVVMKQGPRVPVSRRRKEAFLQLFQNHQ